MHDKAQAVAPRVKYEWKMLNETYALRRQNQPAPSPRSAKDAFLESFPLHSRNLYHFFTRRRAELKRFEESDVVAEDFFDDPAQWNPSTHLTFLDSNLVRLNRSLSHISYDRVEYEMTKRWVDMDRTLNELNHAWETLMKDLPEERRNWFENAVR